MAPNPGAGNRWRWLRAPVEKRAHQGEAFRHVAFGHRNEDCVLVREVFIEVSRSTRPRVRQSPPVLARAANPLACEKPRGGLDDGGYRLARSRLRRTFPRSRTAGRRGSEGATLESRSSGCGPLNPEYARAYRSSMDGGRHVDTACLSGLEPMAAIATYPRGCAGRSARCGFGCAVESGASCSLATPIRFNASSVRSLVS